jgi:hypothetical protein
LILSLSLRGGEESHGAPNLLSPERSEERERIEKKATA